MEQKAALVLGSSGAFGGAVLNELKAKGWAVRRYSRGTDMRTAAQGCQLVVNGLNPPNYHAWDRLIPEITDSVIAAVKGSGATVLIPGNVYPFGVQPAPWGVETPHRPNSRKGRIRMEMEARYRDASDHDQFRAILLRAGDFLGTSPKLAINMVNLRNIQKGRISYLGAADAPHAWAWLPDLARAGVDLAALQDRPAYLDVPFPGLTFSLRDFCHHAERVCGRPMRLTRFPAWIFGVASPFWELGRELREMLYLYEHPHWMEGETLAALLPKFQMTPLESVIRELLAAKGL